MEEKEKPLWIFRMAFWSASDVEFEMLENALGPMRGKQAYATLALILIPIWACVGVMALLDMWRYFFIFATIPAVYFIARIFKNVP